jgi:hypothetical protein
VSRSRVASIAASESSDRLGAAAQREITRRLRALGAKPPLVIGAIMLFAAAFAGIFSRQIVGYEPDEVGYTHLAVGIAHSLTPITLSHGGSQRPNQLYPLLISPIWGLFGNVAAFRITHIWNVLLMSSAAIPGYLLAREVVPRRWAAYVVAALVVLTPWMTLSLAELTEVVAYPACVWALLAMQRALAEPSPKRDLVAIAVIALASFGRLQLVLLAPVLVVAMVIHELGYALAAGGERRERLREAGRRLLRRHAPLSALGLLGVVIGVPLLLGGTLSRLFGFYGDTLAGVTFNSLTFDLARSYFVFIALGLGALPAALSLGFWGESLLSPVSRRAHAFATLSVITIVALTLQVAEVSVRFNEGVLQERYVFYMVPLLAVGMCAALLLTRRPMAMVLGGSLVLALLVGSTHYEAPRSAFWYQVSPAMTGLYDWIAPAFGAAGGPTANPGASRLVSIGVAVLAAGVIVSLLARRVRLPRLLAALAALTLVFCAVETEHALWSVVNGSSSGRGFGDGALTGVDWVDRSLPSGAAAAQVVSNVGGVDHSRGLWEDSEFWNRSIVGAYTFGDVSDSYFGAPRLRLQGATGVVSIDNAAAGSGPGERYIVVAARGFPVALAGTVLGHSPGGTLEVLRAVAPSQAAWAVAGISSNGWLETDRPATLRLYMLRGAAGRCVEVATTFALSSLSSSGRVLSLSGPGVRQRVPVQPGQVRTISTRVCARAATVPQLSLLNEQSPAASDPQLTLQLQRVAVAPA